MSACAPFGEKLPAFSWIVEDEFWPERKTYSLTAPPRDGPVVWLTKPTRTGKGRAEITLSSGMTIVVRPRGPVGLLARDIDVVAFEDFSWEGEAGEAVLVHLRSGKQLWLYGDVQSTPRQDMLLVQDRQFGDFTLVRVTRDAFVTLANLTYQPSPVAASAIWSGKSCVQFEGVNAKILFSLAEASEDAWSRQDLACDARRP